MTGLWIPHSLLQEVVVHCRRELPREACGLLLGKAGKVAAVLPMPNVAEDPEQNFLVDGAAQVRAFRYMVDKGWELTGIFHSHPRALPIPSRSDINQAYYPKALHMIVGLRTPEKPDVRIFRLLRDTSKAVRVHLEINRPSPIKDLAAKNVVGPLVWGRSHG